MRIGFIGLGKMGMAMVTRLLLKHQVVGYDLSASQVAEAEKRGAFPSSSLEELVKQLDPPRTVWLMVPAGQPVDQVIEGLKPHLLPSDTLVDGGNSYFRDSVRRGEDLSKIGVDYLDAGTSGGIEGAQKGVSLTVGGKKDVFQRLEPLLRDLAMPGGLCFCGPSGAGHYVKMVHNGVEYALLQAYGEGFEMLHSGPYKLDLAQIAKTWSNGSVIRSWLLQLAERVFEESPDLSEILGEVGGGETGRWMVEAALDQEIPVPVITSSLLMRYRSRQRDSFTGKFTAALRAEFGGHEVKKAQ